MCHLWDFPGESGEANEKGQEEKSALGYIRSAARKHSAAQVKKILPSITTQPLPFGSCAAPSLVNSTQKGQAFRTQQSSGNENVPPPNDLPFRFLFFVRSCKKASSFSLAGARTVTPLRNVDGVTVSQAYGHRKCRDHIPRAPTPRAGSVGVEEVGRRRTATIVLKRSALFPRRVWGP